MSKVTIGVLALQGAFAKHIEMLQRLDVDTCEVRKPLDLKSCDGVIIPGGESTTILRQLWYIDLFEELAEFAKNKPLFGTCAGLILMSKEIKANNTMKPFGVIDVTVERNAFGSQAESFETMIDVSMKARQTTAFPAVFIRAPRICHSGKHVKVLASFEGEPVLVQEGNHLGATFHPELTDDPLVHAHFISMVKGAQAAKCL